MGEMVQRDWMGEVYIYVYIECFWGCLLIEILMR